MNYIIKRVEQDDGSYHGAVQYLVINQYGTFDWVSEEKKASRMSRYEAAALVVGLTALTGETVFTGFDTTNDIWSYHIESY